MTRRKLDAVFSALTLLIAMRTGPAQTPAEARGIALQDLKHRDGSMHWPKGFDPAFAAQFSHNELFIPAPCEHVFAQMADVTRWPQWFILVKNVRLQEQNQTLGEGRTISLSIFDTPITAKITEWVPGERISWLPETIALSQSKHYHAWHFKSAAGGCNAITEEVGVGPEDARTGPERSFYMHRAHDLWLASLRFASE